ncbi:hypothetical protein B0H13DRAFT_1966744 [Mycena leptocephala]|nr:hypothetical protein B0H13DRAFT_1966744 [Mycena leptocephala]
MLDIVPLELVTEIFIFALPDILSDPHPSNAPLLLTHVCHDWRRVAQSTPQLWSNLTLSDRNVHNHPTFLIEQWLGRANLVALSLWIGYSFPETIMHLISRNSTKWKVLEFHTFGDPRRELSKINPIGGFPSLKKVVIDSNDESFYHINECVVDGFRDAPRLAVLHFHGVPDLLTKLSIPWSQLTSYTCTSRAMGVSDYLRVMSLTPNLVHCKLTTSRFNTSAGNSGIHPHLHLKSLTLHSKNQVTNSPAVLRYITLPALQILDVGVLPVDETETLLSFLARSSCKLVSFSANTRDTLLAPFIPCLQTMPTLSSLRLTIISSDENVSTLVQRLGDDTSFLPNLERLTVVSDGNIVFPYGALIETLTARSTSESIVRLRQFALCWTSQPDPSFFPVPHIGRQLLATGVAFHLGPDHVNPEFFHP